MADLKTSYMGIDLDNPLVVSSSGITGSVDGVAVNFPVNHCISEA